MADRTKNIKLYVGNLPYEATDQDLRKLLQGCGHIRFLLIRKDKHTNKSKGYAHVEYRHEWEAVEAFKRLLGKDIRGRVLKVDFCEDTLRHRYSNLINAANAAFQNGTVQSLSHDLHGCPDFPSEPYPHGNVLLCSPTGFNCMPYPVSAVDITLDGEFTNKRVRRDEVQLIDDQGRLCNDDLFHFIRGMTMFDVANVVDIINQFMKKSLMNTRYILQENPNMTIALIHAKMLLGKVFLGKGRITAPERELAATLNYFHAT